MDYWEADQLCGKNKEFILSLFPSGKIYTTFFPAEARNALGKVGKDTEPVVHMLKKIGFKYHDQVDPFDGGPHLWGEVDELLPIKKISRYTFSTTSDGVAQGTHESGILTPIEHQAGQFRAIAVKAMIHEGKLWLPEVQDKMLYSVLGLSPGDTVAFMPYY